MEEKILSLGRKSQKGKNFLSLLYSHPIIDAKLVQKNLDMSHPTANNLIKDFEKLGILKELTGFKRNRLFAFEKYLKIFE